MKRERGERRNCQLYDFQSDNGKKKKKKGGRKTRRFSMGHH